MLKILFFIPSAFRSFGIILYLFVKYVLYIREMNAQMLGVAVRLGVAAGMQFQALYLCNFREFCRRIVRKQIIEEQNRRRVMEMANESD